MVEGAGFENQCSLATGGSNPSPSANKETFVRVMFLSLLLLIAGCSEGPKVVEVVECPDLSIMGDMVRVNRFEDGELVWQAMARRCDGETNRIMTGAASLVIFGDGGRVSKQVSARSITISTEDIMMTNYFLFDFDKPRDSAYITGLHGGFRRDHGEWVHYEEFADVGSIFGGD